jgi:hypothetical protein
MQGSQRRRYGARVAMLFALASGITAAADAPAPVEALWTPKQLNFTYMGFTSRYSCDGLRDKLRGVLLKLGARKDLTITSTGCSGGYGRVSPFPGVSAKLHVLEPLTDKNAPKDGSKPVAAQWTGVDLVPTGDPLLAAGDCELTEQIKQRVLPLFTSRNVAYSSTCIPNQLTIGGTKLAAEVLTTDQKDAKDSKSR